MKNDRSRRAVRAAIDFGEGKITKEEREDEFAKGCAKYWIEFWYGQIHSDEYYEAMVKKYRKSLTRKPQ
jgi:hypothetical protein